MNDFETLYRRYASAVFRFSWGLCGDRALAEDLVSETFVRVLTRAPKIRTRTARAYLLTIARNCYLMGLRRSRRELPLPEELLAPERDLAGQLDDQRRLKATLAALATLAEGERSALLLRADHELSYQEVAAALEISVTAAKVRVHRARRHLVRALAEQGRES